MTEICTEKTSAEDKTLSSHENLELVGRVRKVIYHPLDWTEFVLGGRDPKDAIDWPDV
ncbi:hypothetical protein SCHPADRAFT_903176 [Schizopora paradoxa]|uniref:Uncharacterized protein n=1 Tax=Schizopora paradoxa TaxID=27342 RepID=A0A0H2RSQ6_9AGAM|nr:hypothetical protein SCHPADRAFT_903176 [Schizopora paradoxa]